MFFKSWLGVFGLSLAVAPAIAFIPSELEEEEDDDFLDEAEIIEDEYDEEKEERENRQANEDFQRLIKKMDDYSFRIFLPCHVGTGWILDYEMPAKAGDYPMKWYIATNAHVANIFRFAEDSYEKELPKPALKEKPNYEKFADFGLTTADGSCSAWEEHNYFDFNLSRASTGKILKSNHGAIRNNLMNIPKLFYVPINFLEKNEALGVKENNFRDFAVIEVEFTNKEYAEALTGEFYKNYKVGSPEALNVFARPLSERKSWRQLRKSYDNYFSLGYSFRKDWFSYEHNFDSKQGVASILSDDTKYKGHVSATKFDRENPKKMVWWGNKRLNSLGYFYSLQYRSMSGGASGGLVVDRDGNVLGIRSLGNSATDTSLIVPLRSNKIIKKGHFASPAYDLILGGVPGQRTSYKQQVEKYKKKTYLSENGWNHPWNARMNPTKSSCLGTMCLRS